jgi:hypothetical protein
MLFLPRHGEDRRAGNIRKLLLIGLLVAAGVAVPARSNAQNQPAAAAGAKPPKPKLVCKEVDPPTGSHVGGGTVCRTAEAWAADENEAQREVDNEAQRMRALHAYEQNQDRMSAPLPK